MKIAFALITAAIVATPSVADEAANPAKTPTNYIALALADGPTDAERLVLSFRGTDSTDVVRMAFSACYKRAAVGYMHTCQVWYGDAWIVGTACQTTSTKMDAKVVRFGIGDDPNSPEAAHQKAIETIRKAEHGDVSDCRVVAEYNANDMKSARSVATDDE